MELLNVNEDACNYLQNRPNSWRLRLQRFRRWFHNVWAWEVLCYAGSLLFLIILVILLRHYDGKPRSERPSDRTLNALIASGFTVVKGLMIICVSACLGHCKYLFNKDSRLIDLEAYNEASQGLIGAIWLLLRPRITKISIMSAFIIIAAVAIDPSAQQLVNYPTRSAAVSSDATLNIVVSMRDRFIYEVTGYDEITNMTKGGSLVKYNLARLASTDSSGARTRKIQARHICPSSHCEWPEYLTLAACSRCKDVHEDLQVEVDQSPFITSEASPRTYRGSLPNGHVLDVVTNRSNIDAMNISTTKLSLENLDGLLDSYLVSFSLILLRQFPNTPREGVKRFPSWNERYIHQIPSPTWKYLWGEWAAYQCSMSLCVQQRKASVRNGHFRDRATNSRNLPLDCSYHTSFYFSPDVRQDSLQKGADWLDDHHKWCVMDYPDQEVYFNWTDGLTNRHYSTPPGTREHGPSPPTFFLDRNEGSAGWSWKRLLLDDGMQQAGTSFLVSPDSFRRWRGYLEHEFDLQYEELSTGDDDSSRIATASSGTALLMYTEALYSIRSYLRQFAKHITTIIRNEAEYISTANGTVYEKEVFVEVVWAWLILPIALLSCTLIVLLYTMRETKRLNLKPWKSSTLPLLVDGLEFSNESDYLVDISESVERAKKTPLMLHKFWRSMSREQSSSRCDEDSIDLTLDAS